MDYNIQNLVLQNSYHEQLLKLNLSTKQIEQILDITAGLLLDTSAKNGIIYPGIFTGDEIWQNNWLN